MLIAVNTAVFLYQVSLGRKMEYFILRTAVIPYEIVHLEDIYPGSIVPLPLTLITAMFVHGNLLHLGGNMLYLWIFGNNIEDALGHFRFLLFYVVCGLIASFLHISIYPHSTIPMIGASGAIAGILGAYLLLYPKARVHTLIFFIFFIRIVRLPAALLLTFWFVIQILNSVQGGGVAWYAHIGGFIAGLVLVKPFMKV